MVKGYVGVQREKGWKGGMGGPDFMTVEGPGFSLSGPAHIDQVGSNFGHEYPIFLKRVYLTFLPHLFFTAPALRLQLRTALGLYNK